MRLAIRPARTGTMIMFMMDSIMPTNLTCTSRPASTFIMNGVITGDINVEQEVIVTDRATSPLAK